MLYYIAGTLFRAAIAFMPRPRGVSDARSRLLDAAEALLVSGGAPALTTRAVCASAGVRAPTLYHHVGDKDGLVAAVLERAAEAFLASRSAEAPGTLSGVWDLYLDFALGHPALFALAMQRPETVYDALGAHGGRLGDVLLALRAEGRLRVEVGVAFHSVRAAVQGVATLLEEGVDVADVRAAGAALRDAIVSAFTEVVA